MVAVALPAGAATTATTHVGDLPHGSDYRTHKSATVWISANPCEWNDMFT